MIVSLFGALAGLAWLSAVIHVLMLLPHRQDGVSLGSLAFNGYKFFVASTFKTSGHGLHRRFLISGAAFFAFVVLGMVAGVLSR
jgi:hypothetical protein